MDPFRLFYSYAPKDETLCRQLEQHLSPLRRQELISDWHRCNISAGTEWAREINTHLNAAHIILLLISSDFLASDYCYSIEMRQALERHEAGGACVIPVLLRRVSLEGTSFSKLQALPTNGIPVMNWPNIDDAFVDIVDGIRRVVDDLRKPPPQEDPILINAVQKLINGPGGQIDAVKYIINVLDKLGQEQKNVSELKKVHNMLHEVEAALAPLRDYIYSKRKLVQGVLDIDYIGSEWRKVWRKINKIRVFAEQKMTYLGEKRLKIENDNMSGPLWIIELLSLQKDFDAALGERNIQEMGEISEELLDKSRTYLQWIDSRLLIAVDQVDRLSDQILRSLHYETTINA